MPGKLSPWAWTAEPRGLEGRLLRKGLLLTALLAQNSVTPKDLEPGGMKG